MRIGDRKYKKKISNAKNSISVRPDNAMQWVSNAKKMQFPISTPSADGCCSSPLASGGRCCSWETGSVQPLASGGMLREWFE